MFDDIHLFDSITYDSVGIVPSEFYRGKFLGAPGLHNILSAADNDYDIEFDRVRFLTEEVRGPRILDVGCGTAPFAGTLREAILPTRITGIDLDPECVKIARTVYDEAFHFDLGGRLPFGDSSFDTVFSTDVFGHIEFRHKDAVIQELHRVTVPGGRSVHVIECGYLDYNAMRPHDPSDPLSTYIRMEGHIGVETASALKKRWLQFFPSVTVVNASFYPLAAVSTLLADPNLPRSLRAILDDYDPGQRKAIQVVFGYLVQKLRRELNARAPSALFPDHTSDNPLQWPSGLAYLVAEKT